MNDTNNVRMWICETDRYGATDNKFYIDNPAHVPRIGEFVDSDGVGGHVKLVQYHHRIKDQKLDETAEFSLIIMIYLSETK